MIRFGIIGMGIRGTLFADTIAQNPFAQVVAVCDANAATADAAAKKYGAAAYHAYEELLDDAKPDALIIATPDFMHRDICIAAAARGIDMMIEKPFATTPGECLEMLAAIRAGGVKCLVAFENRWSVPFIHAKGMMQAGELGDVLNIYAHLNNTLFVPTKMLSWAGKSTPAWFLFPHLIDMACWLTGKSVRAAYATGVKKKLAGMGIDTFDSIQSVLTFEDGSSGVFTTTWVLPESRPVIADLRMEFVGEKSNLTIDLGDQTLQHYTAQGCVNPRVLGTPIGGRLTAAPCLMLHEFIDCLREGRAMPAPQEDGARNTMIVCAIHESIRTGRCEQVHSIG